jgi:putative transposase
MAGVQELTPVLGTGCACKARGLWRGAPKRQRARAHHKAMVGPHRPRAARPTPPLALDAMERQVLLDTLNSDRFVDTAPAAVHAEVDPEFGTGV